MRRPFFQRAGMMAAAVLILIWPNGKSLAASGDDQGTTAAVKVEAEKVDRVRQLMDEGQKKWQEWEPALSQAAKRLQKEFEDSGKWEYEVMAVGTEDAAALAARLNKKGQEGWECFAAVSLAGGQHLLLRKRHGGPMVELPMRALFSMIMYQTLISGGRH